MPLRVPRPLAQLVFVLSAVGVVGWYAAYRLDPLRRTPSTVERIGGDEFLRAGNGATAIPGGRDTVVVFSNFGCVWCEVLWNAVDSMRTDGTAPTVLLRHHVVPADTVGYLAAAAFECASKRGGSEAAARALFRLSRDSLLGSQRALANALGFESPDEISRCSEDVAVRRALSRDSALAVDFTVRGTPALFTRKHRVRGALTRLELEALFADARRGW